MVSCSAFRDDGYLKAFFNFSAQHTPKARNDNTRPFLNAPRAAEVHPRPLTQTNNITYRMVSWENPDELTEWKTGLLQETWASGNLLQGAPQAVKLWVASTHDNMLGALQARDRLRNNNTVSMLKAQIGKNREPVAVSFETLPFIAPYAQPLRSFRPNV